MAPLPITRSRADKIGKRLAQGIGTDEDERDLALFLAAYDAAKEGVVRTLREQGVRGVGRTKSRTTLLDKVRRSSSLKSIQDVAGVRVVVDGGRSEQDETVRRVAAAFGGWREDAYTDRRKEPMHGYRAVHYIVEHEGLPVEVQVRTPMQHSWAEIVEKLGDKWGRGIRYGEEPPDKDAPCMAGAEMTRGELWAVCLEASEVMDAIEEYERTLDVEETDTLAQFAEWESTVRHWFDALADLAAQVDAVERA